MAVLEDEFGDVIRKARMGLDLEPAQVAAHLGIPASRLAEWEKYQGGPDAEQLARLAAMLQLPADRLTASRHEAFVPATPPETIGDMRLVRVPVRSKEDGYEENCYLWIWADGMAVIDPGFEPETILAAIAKAGVPVLAYLITHHHWDHVSALAQVHAAHQAPIWVNRQEQDPLLIDPLERDLRVLEGDEAIAVGPHEIQALHTPGHTAGGTTYFVPGVAAVGDVLFAGSVGRSFMGDGGYGILLHTVRQRLLQMPPATVLCPGHGPMTTVAEEAANNPFAVAI